MKRLVITTFKDSKHSFLHALEDGEINYSKVVEFAKVPLAAGDKISFFADLSEAMPWNALSKVVVAWIEAKASRQVNITLEDNTSFMAKGYSVKEVEKMLAKSKAMAVIDTNENHKT